MARPMLTQVACTYVPVWEGVFEKWTHGWVNKNFWRVRYVLGSKEDALQECAMVWAKCAARYAGQIDNPAWFMSLYTVSVTRHWHSLSDQDTSCPTRYSDNISSNTDDNTSTADSIDLQAGAELSEQPAGFLAAQLACASNELKEVFLLLANAPSEVLSIVFADTDDAMTNRRLCRWLKFTRGVDVVAELRQILSA